MYSRKSVAPSMEPWGTPALTGYSCEDFPKLSITEKRRNNAKYLSWNFIRLKFVKKTSMSNPLALEISSATTQVAPDLLKASASLSDTTVRRSAVDWEDLKSY